MVHAEQLQPCFYQVIVLHQEIFPVVFLCDKESAHQLQGRFSHCRFLVYQLSSKAIEYPLAAAIDQAITVI
jgi:hypothetical protein